MIAAPSRVAALALLVAGCSDGVGPPPVQCAPDQKVEVAVSSDPIPVFSWTPACGLSSLRVWDQHLTSGWTLYTGPRSFENRLRSGVRYGRVPPEGIEPGPATPLISGRPYTVTVFRWNGDSTGGFHDEVGSATFER
ncbi:MAG TPA: hypothetical protein VNO19_11860 [Gemmatimonadales bacterium]|nr:hypothetical protein [Gemmatimonadales bacterium]